MGGKGSGRKPDFVKKFNPNVAKTNVDSFNLPNYSGVDKHLGLNVDKTLWNYDEGDIYYNDGSVGIGTSSPERLLHVSGGDILLNNNQILRWKSSTGGNTNVLYLDSSDNVQIAAGAGATGFTSISSGGGIEAMKLQADGDIEIMNGNVGIGTTTPSEILEVRGSGANAGKIHIESKANQAAGNTAEITLSPATIYTSSNAPRIYSYIENTNKVSLRFDSYNHGRTQAMVIDEDGNVGIGTTSPTHKLEIGETSDANDNILMINTDGSHEGEIHFRDAAATDGGIKYDHANRLLNFRTGNAWDRMVIDSSGNVGIGTTSPSAKLEVNGDVNVTGQLLAADTSEPASISLSGAVFVSGGALYYKGYGGTVTQLAAS